MSLLFFVIGSSLALHAQQAPLTCVPSAVPSLVRMEGLAERLGDVVLNCSGPANIAVAGNFTLFTTVNITNRINAARVPTDVTLTVEGAASFTGVVSGQRLDFNGVSFTVPPSGRVVLRIQGVRGNAAQVNLQRQPINAYLSTTTIVALTGNPVAVGLVERGLLATFSSSGIRCTGSPVPSGDMTLTRLFGAGTRFASTRVTEGFASAFVRRGGQEANGTRLLARFSGLPAGARVFVPDVIAGSSALEPTSGGDLGLPRSGGVYQPTAAGSLMLSSVVGADAAGAGGFALFTPGPVGSPASAFDTAGELPVVNSEAFAVYEVMDSNPSVAESAQFPAFFGIAGQQVTALVQERISLAPVSTDAMASETAPVPRFVALAPPSDCPALGDCESDIFPRLQVQQYESLFFTAIAGGAAMQPPGYVTVRNTGGGYLNWIAYVTYTSGSDWIQMIRGTDEQNASLRVFIRPERLAPGTYEAVLTVDAGPLSGSRSLPVRLVVNPAPAVPAPPAAPAVIVTAVTNGANFLPGPIAPGSIATLKGAKLTGRDVRVTFDNIPATLLYVSEGQINLRVPVELAGKSSAQLVVTVDGVSSAAQSVSLAPLAPAIFANGVLNQDNRVNSPAAGAKAGTVLQIFATGLPEVSSAVNARVHDWDNQVPLYAGPAPGLPGVQQVNVAIPEGLPAMQTEVAVCGFSPTNQRVCSAPVKIWLAE